MLRLSRSGVYYKPRPVPAAKTGDHAADRCAASETSVRGSRMLRDLLRAKALLSAGSMVRDDDAAHGYRGLYRRPTRQSPRWAIRFTRICCAVWRSSARTRYGPWISRTSRWRVVSSISAAVVDWFTRRCSGLAAVDHDGGRFLHRRGRGGACQIWPPRDFQHRPGQPIHRRRFTGLLLKNNIAISMDGKGSWRDNVFVERLWRSVKYEEVYLRGYDSVADARASLGRYLVFYNR